MITIVSQIASISSTICVEIITIVFFDISETIFLNLNLSSGSRPAVGSSNIIILGFPSRD